MDKKSAYELCAVAGAQGMAEALGITRSAVAQWPDPLRPRQVHEVLGAAVRLGRLRLAPEDAARVAAALEQSAPPEHSAAA
jgi:DNA-binding transcriptional regulator YdaS (Cro superfamily)